MKKPVTSVDPTGLGEIYFVPFIAGCVFTFEASLE